MTDLGIEPLAENQGIVSAMAAQSILLCKYLALGGSVILCWLLASTMWPGEALKLSTLRYA